jgi:hypothetical protein
MRDHSPLVVDAFRGTFDRGEDEVCPAGFFLSSLNYRFNKGGVYTREGSENDVLAAPIVANIKVRRMELYERTGEAQRLLILNDVGQIWDSVTGIMILSIPTMIDFSVTVMFERAYITPHNGLTGLPGEKLYVYEGAGTARPAGGGGPSSTPIVAANSASSGRIDFGVHHFGVAFESATGFISTIGGFVALSSPGELKADLSAIPLGPAGTVARVIVATKEVLPENAQGFDVQTYYFVPDGRIPNNTGTTITVDFYDADLMDDASYLLEQLSEIPAGVGIGQYKSSLIVWGENASPSIIRVSKPGEPEAHNGAEGYLTVYPGIGGGVKNCTEYRNQIIICKSHRTYASLGNDDSPAFWEVGEIDGSVGTECHGIGQILNIGSNVEDRLFIADRAGLRLFIGTFSDEGILSYNVDDIWGRITSTAFNQVEVSIDAINFHIYAALPLDGATTPNHILYGDYSEGLSEETIRWTLWKFPVNPTSIVVSLVSGIPVLKFGSINSGVVKLVPELKLDLGIRIDNLLKFPLFPVGGEDEIINHFTGIGLRARGEGVLDIKAEGLDGVMSIQAQSLVLVEKPGKSLWRGFNFTAGHCSITLVQVNAGSWMILTKFILYMSPVWESRPALS